MPTPSHTDYSPAKPDGSTGTGTTFDTATRENERALRDMIILGFAEGFVESRTNGTGTAAQPQFVTYYNSSLGIGFRLNITWTGFNPTTVAEEWTNDSQATWTNIATHVLTFDGSQNVTACTNGGGAVVLLMEVWAKALKATSDIAAHAAATGTAVHGLGSAAVANLTAMVIAGTSSFDGTGGIGQTTRMKVNAKRVVEDVELLTPALNAGVTIDWANFECSNITVNGTHALTFTGVTSGHHSHTIEIDNFNAVTWPGGLVNWGAAGIPSIAGPASVSIDTINSGSLFRARVNWS